MDGALRVARQHHLSAGRPSRWKMIGRELSYHGTTLATLAVGGHAKRRAGFEPLLFEAPKAPACYPLRCSLCRRPEGCSLACADALEELILREGPGDGGRVRGRAGRRLDGGRPGACRRATGRGSPRSAAATACC